MKIAINTPAGNIGGALTQQLLDAGQELILLTRSPEKVKAFEKRGAKVFKGNLTDESFVINATKGADVLFWLTPADYTSDDMRRDQKKLGRIAAAAVRANKIPRVVDLSSIGAQHERGTGPIAGLHDVEKILDETGAHVTHLRPGYFMENYFMSASTIASEGAVYLPVPGTLVMPMIATSDIAKAAADRILDTTWTGQSVIELVGPEDLTFEGAARTLSSAIGKDIKHVTTPPEQIRQAMTGMGLSANVADTMLEMYEAFNNGTVAPESTPRQTPTTLDAFARNVLKPALEAMKK